MLDLELTSMLVSLLQAQTARDKQKTIGASNASTPCNKCLAEDMLGVERDPSFAWWPSKEGTFIHAGIENELRTNPKMNKLFGDPLIEHNMEIGVVPGYGPVRSTSDLYIPERKLVMDWKTTDANKLKQYHIADEHDLEPDPELFSTYAYEKVMDHAFTMKKYLIQLHLYGLGMVREGYEVDHVAMAFIVRGGLDASSMAVFRYKYDPEFAQRAWERIELLWLYLEEGQTPDDFDGNPFCWYCQNKRG